MKLIKLGFGAVGFATVLAAGPVFAQSSMTCGDYLKADKQMAAQMGGASASTGDAKMDAAAAAMDKALRDYCTKNPTVSVDKAMMDVMK